jgi:hypothetical protein
LVGIVLTSVSLPFLAKADGRTEPDSTLKFDPIKITLKPTIVYLENVDTPSLLNLTNVVNWVLAAFIVTFSTWRVS